MTVASIATALALVINEVDTVYYGVMPDADDGSFDTVLALRDYPLVRPEHAFGYAPPIYTPFGLAVHARATTQDSARSLCQSAYDALLEMGYLAISPPVTVGWDEAGRFEVMAEVQAHDIYDYSATPGTP